MAKELARKDELSQEGLADLEEEMWGMRRQEVATALTRFAPHAGEDFPQPEGGWMSTPGPVAKLLLTKMYGFNVPTRNKPKIPRECVDAIVRWWEPLFPDEEEATNTLDEKWAAIEKWRPDVNQDTGALTSEAVDRFARKRVEEENAKERAELEQRELQRQRELVQRETAAKKRQDEAAAAEFAAEVDELQQQERLAEEASRNLGEDFEDSSDWGSFSSSKPVMSRKESSASTSFGMATSLGRREETGGSLRTPVPDLHKRLTGGMKRTMPPRDQGRRVRQNFSGMSRDDLVMLLEGQSGGAEEEAYQAPTPARQPHQPAVEAEVTCPDGGRTFQRIGATQPEMDRAKREFNANAWDRRESCLQGPEGWKAVVC